MEASRLTERARGLRLRNVLDLTLRDLATEFGVASAAVAHWESGKRRMPGPPVVPPLGDRPALATWRVTTRRVWPGLQKLAHVRVSSVVAGRPSSAELIGNKSKSCFYGKHESKCSRRTVDVRIRRVRGNRRLGIRSC
jgi:transcriptional regulator with XRE-family HTH domain